MAAKRASDRAKSTGVFGQARKPTKMFRAGLYARVSTNDQQTIPLQIYEPRPLRRDDVYYISAAPSANTPFVGAGPSPCW